MEDSRPILLMDVARKAGVSLATASLALSSQGTISLKTRERVRLLAEEMGYRPNLAASLLARQKQIGTQSNVPIAVIGTNLVSPFMTAFLHHATQRGFLVEGPKDLDYSDIPKLFRIFYHRGIRGIIIDQSIDTGKITAKDVEPFSILFHGQPLNDHRFHRVSPDYFEGTRMLWETMWARGYRRIGAMLYRHPRDIMDDFAREAAVVNSQIRHHAPRIPLFTNHFSVKNVPRIIEWIREIKADAVIGFTAGQYYMLKDAGIRIPQDLAYAALHVSQSHPVPITGLHTDYDELGRITVSQLDSMIRHNETGFPARPHQVLVSPVFWEGETLPVRQPSHPKPMKKSKKTDRTLR